MTPDAAYLGRTVDLSIAGNGTSWSAGTTVSFTDPNIKVNKVTAASVTGLLVNVSIGDGATVGTDDVTVDDDGVEETYSGAFQVLEPIKVTTDQTGGVPQGGYADFHVQMLDITTPFDSNASNITIGLSDMNLGVTAPTVDGDYGIDVLVLADVTEAPAPVDMVVTSDGIDSPQAKAFNVVARPPIALTSGTQAMGMIQNLDDNVLYKYAPADASLRFEQLQLSTDATAGGAIIPKSGKWSDSQVGFIGLYGVASTSTDLNYLVVGDSATLLGDPFGGAVPYSFTVTFFDTQVTGVTWSMTNTTPSAAQSITALPGLVQNANLVISGSNPSDEWYEVAVSGSSASSPKTLHVATGGDPATATVIDVFTEADAMTTPLPMPDYTSGDNGGQEDLPASITTDGNYFIHVYASPSFFSSTDSTYELFVEVK